MRKVKCWARVPEGLSMASTLHRSAKRSAASASADRHEGVRGEGKWE